LTGGYGRAWSTGLEIAACPGQETTVARLVLNEALAWSADWRAISLLRIRPNARIIPAIITQASQLGLAVHMELFGPAVAGRLPKDMRSFEKQMPSAGMRKEVGRYRRRLLKEFDSVEFTDCCSSAEVHDWIETMKQLDVDSRTQRGMSSSNFADPGWIRYLTDTSRMMHEVGVMRLKRLEVDGKPAAVRLYAMWKGTLTFIQTAFDWEFRRWRVGNVLLHECISEGLEAGANRIDFISGEHGFKTQFYGGRECLLNLHLVPKNTPFASARLAARFLATGFRKTAKSFLLRR